MKTKFQKPLNLNTTDPLTRYSVTRLSDGWERWTTRKPRREVCQNHNLMVWDHVEKCQITR